MTGGAELIERLRLVCGREHVLSAQAELATYRSDGVIRDGAAPLAVALPADAAEVASIVRACRDAGVPFVARGAGTSTHGRALAPSGGVVVALTRMRRILALDLANDEITAEPGVPAVAVNEAVSPSHRFGQDAVSTVGGAAADGNADVSALQLVTPDGDVVRIDSRTPGYDVCGAFAGSQGISGIAVALTLRLPRVGLA